MAALFFNGLKESVTLLGQMLLLAKLGVTRQKVESQNGCYKKTRHAKNLPKKKQFLSPDTHTYVCVARGKKCSFFRKFGVLYFLQTHVLRFALLPNYRQIRRQRDVTLIQFSIIYLIYIEEFPNLKNL